MNKRFLILLLSTTLLSLQACTFLRDVSNKEPIAQSPTDRTFGAFFDDSTIESVITVNLRKTNPAFRDAHISVVSFNGVVLLVGQVGSPELRAQASEIAHKVQKVRQVHNELEVSGNTSMIARSNDSWLTSKVKSKLLVNSDTPGNNMKIVTEKGVVYLMGLISTETGEKAIDVARNTGGVQKVVTVFEYINP